MRRHLPCALLVLTAALAGGAVGCCTRDVREASGELRDAAVGLAAASEHLEAAWAPFRAASAPRAGLDEDDERAWPGVADDIDDAIARMRESAIQVRDAADATAQRAGAEPR